MSKHSTTVEWNRKRVRYTKEALTRKWDDHLGYVRRANDTHALVDWCDEAGVPTGFSLERLSDLRRVG